MDSTNEKSVFISQTIMNRGKESWLGVAAADAPKSEETDDLGVAAQAEETVVLSLAFSLCFEKALSSITSLTVVFIILELKVASTHFRRISENIRKLNFAVRVVFVSSTVITDCNGER